MNFIDLLDPIVRELLPASLRIVRTPAIDVRDHSGRCHVSIVESGAFVSVSDKYTWNGCTIFDMVQPNSIPNLVAHLNQIMIWFDENNRC
jgi:hypothetical protein